MHQQECCFKSHEEEMPLALGLCTEPDFFGCTSCILWQIHVFAILTNLQSSWTLFLLGIYSEGNINPFGIGDLGNCVQVTCLRNEHGISKITCTSLPLQPTQQKDFWCKLQIVANFVPYNSCNMSTEAWPCTSKALHGIFAEALIISWCVFQANTYSHSAHLKILMQQRMGLLQYRTWQAFPEKQTTNQTSSHEKKLRSLRSDHSCSSADDYSTTYATTSSAAKPPNVSAEI